MGGSMPSRDLLQVLHNQEVIMATLAELELKVDAQATEITALKAAIDAEQVEVNAALAALQQAVADLQAQIDAGAPDQAALQRIADKLDAANSQLAAAKIDVEGTVPPPFPAG